MIGLSSWWTALSGRERRLVTLMLVLVGGTVLWLGVWRPVEAGITSGWVRYGAAVDVNASVRAKIAALKTAPAARPAGDAAIGQSVAQSASEAGLAITIGSARAGPLLAWLSGLEARGVQVETISMTPGNTPGTVVVQAVLREVGA
jgi:general secretion pathway protein M